MGWFADEPGGLNRIYAGLLNSLPAEGLSVRGLVAGSDAAAAAPPVLEFFARREAPMWQRLYACHRSLAMALRSHAVDVVAAHFALYALPAVRLLRDRQFVFHFHGPWAGESRVEGTGAVGVGVKRAIEGLVYGRANRFITLSDAFAGILVRDYGIARERIDVIPGGIDAARFNVATTRAEACALLGLPPDRPLVLSVRRLIRRVGLERLIDAMTTVRSRVPEALLLIAGVGPIREELEALVRERDLRNHVRFLGFVGEHLLPQLYRACAVSVVPSLSLEGFGLPTLESMAAGTPVLVTPVGGLPETVMALDPALVLPDTSSVALAEALTRALREPGSLPTAAACVGHVRANFDWPVISAKVRSVYQTTGRN